MSKQLKICRNKSRKILSLLQIGFTLIVFIISFGILLLNHNDQPIKSYIGQLLYFLNNNPNPDWLAQVEIIILAITLSMVLKKGLTRKNVSIPDSHN